MAKLSYDEVVAFEKITQRNYERALNRAFEAEALVGQFKLERYFLIKTIRKAHDFFKSPGNRRDEEETLAALQDALDAEQPSIMTDTKAAGAAPGPSDALLPCPFCGGLAEMHGAPPRLAPEQWVQCTVCRASSDTRSGADSATASWNRRRSTVAQGTPETADDEDRMWKISKLIAVMQSVLEQFGDTCVYVRRGGMAWGALALNREADDKKNGVFDLQAQHDRDMEERYGQVQRLMKSRDEFMERAIAAEAQLAATPPPSPTAPAQEAELRQHEDSFYRLIRSLLTDVAVAKLGVTSGRANELLHKLNYVESLRSSSVSSTEGGSK